MIYLDIEIFRYINMLEIRKEDLNLFKALSDETRLKIVLALLDGEKAAMEIVPYTGKAQPTVSLNLKLLEHLGIIGSRRDGKFIRYSIKNEKVGEMIDLVKK